MTSRDLAGAIRAAFDASRRMYVRSAEEGPDSTDAAIAGALNDAESRVLALIEAEPVGGAKPWHDGMTLVTHPDGTRCWHRSPKWLAASDAGSEPVGGNGPTAEQQERFKWAANERADRAEAALRAAIEVRRVQTSAGLILVVGPFDPAVPAELDAFAGIEGDETPLHQHHGRSSNTGKEAG